MELIAMKLAPILLCAALLILNGVSAQQPPIPGQENQCRSELESLRYHVYSEMADSKKELDSLRTDLQYWQNTTLSILKKYMDREADVKTSSCQCDIELDQMTAGKINADHSGKINITEEIVHQMREVMKEHRRAQSDELREIISEMSSGRLPLGTFLNPAPSCKDVNGSSGNYWIRNAGTGYANLEYCDMNRRCCDSTGGWMRVAFLDMTNPNHRCPSIFRSISSPLRMCGRPGIGCYSTTYSVDGVAYSRVCGRVKAYQYYTPNAFRAYKTNRAIMIDNAYVDGVILTHGSGPRKHIWTFAAAIDEARSDKSVCSCTKTDTFYTGVVPPFIRNDYFCETGSRYSYQQQWYTADPLWDGEGCGATSSCCEFNNPPWFCKELPQATTDDIELRLCADESTSNEEVGIEQVELFVQ